MRFTNSENCIVFLSGFLKQMPSIETNYSTDLIIVIQRYCTHEQAMQNHRIIINQQDAKKIFQAGLVDMPIAIRGNIRSRIQTEIVAHEIDLQICPHSNSQYAGNSHIVVH